MQKYKLPVLYLLFLVLLLPLSLSGQILDDSTKLVYGPTTTRYITESDLLYNADPTDFAYPDTLINNFYQFDELERLDYRYQNLGNVGTALSPIFYEAPEVIGLRSGFDVYDYWFYAPEDFEYYNTRSPYTDLTYFLAGNGRSLVEVTHSRNVTPNWNVGFDFRRLTADKQIGPTRRRGDKQIVSTAYDLFTYYKTQDLRYQVLANFSRLKHTVDESGGIAVNVLPEDISNIIGYEDSEIRLENASSELLRINYHLFHQYKVNELTEVYHRFDRQTEANEYIDDPLSRDLRYYEQALINETITHDSLHQSYWQNELGLKGEVAALYYRLYYKRKDIRYAPKYLQPLEESEDYTGFSLRLAADSSLMLSAEGEYLWGGYYRAAGFIRFKWLQAGLSRTKFKPAYITQTYFGNHGEWHNQFEAPVANELNAAANIPFKRLQFSAGVRAALVERPLYFTADSLTLNGRPVNVRPVQTTGSAQTLSPFASFRWEFVPRIFWENELTYSMVSGEAAEAFHVPEWLYNTSIYYEGEMFGGNLVGQLGVDANWRSAYYANAYDPVMQQFLVQDEFLVPAYPIINLFFGFRINTTRVFLRMSHLNEGIPDNGYFTTPFYSGTGRTFDLGIDWLFFD
ncbi:putative porin [Nafulsella turpanensis]|uniref:putative porin n=1 Tax=Nafulsella turpanensis TaxID=1265690 RepID=UPI001F3667E8|nr:putative porin [Nafulsella turpanensis]